MKFSVIYIDPPWRYSSADCLHPTSRLNGKNDIHYDTLTLNDLKELPINNVAADDCIMFMWVVSPMLPEALELMKAWKFKYGTIAFIWHKQMHNPGHYTMSECEICLVMRKGKIPTPRGSRNERQFFSEMRTKHSKKPEEVRKRIERMFPTQSKLEVFARETKDGWVSIGNDIDGKDIRESLKGLIDAH